MKKTDSDINEEMLKDEKKESLPTDDKSEQKQQKDQSEEVATNDESDNNETVSNEQLNAQELAAENANLKKEIALLKLNVKEEFKQDALLLVENLVNDGIEFSQALATVIGKYPQFVNSTVPKLNLGGPTPGIGISRKDRDAFVSGVKNNFLGGK